MPVTEELLAPIAGGNPAGADLRYDPIYDKIKEARREDLDVPAGAWETARKTADWPLVVKQCTEVLSKRSKDLQVGAWLTEALLRREGIAGLRAGLELLHQFLAQFWEHLYPEIEDGDLELRAAPLEWVGLKLESAVRMAPLNGSGHGLLDYTESVKIPSESAAESDREKKALRQEAINAGKVTIEDWEQAVAATPKAWYKTLVADLDGTLTAIDELERIGDERFGHDAPSYRPLREALEAVRVVARQVLARKLQDDPDPVEETVADRAGSGELRASPGAPAESAAPGNTPAGAGAPAPQPRSRDDAAARVAAAARFMRAEAPGDPAPYLMLRGLRWGELRGGDGIDEKLLAAPPTELRTRLKTLLLDENWAELLELAEDTMAQPYGRGWLDLQRYVLTACAGLGDDYQAVARAIRRSLKGLLEELPALPELALMDDSPTANDETRQWLRAQALLPGAAEAPREEAELAVDRLAVSRGAARRDGLFERARELQRRGRAQDAIELLVGEVSRERSARARFIRRSQAASVMVDAGLDAVAMPILRELIAEIDNHQLEAWEAGDVVSEPLGLLWRCLKKQGDDWSTMEELYLRICRLDPLQAVRFARMSEDGAEGN